MEAYNTRKEFMKISPCKTNRYFLDKFKTLRRMKSCNTDTTNNDYTTNKRFLKLNIQLDKANSSQLNLDEEEYHTNTTLDQQWNQILQENENKPNNYITYNTNTNASLLASPKDMPKEITKNRYRNLKSTKSMQSKCSFFESMKNYNYTSKDREDSYFGRIQNLMLFEDDEGFISNVSCLPFLLLHDPSVYRYSISDYEIMRLKDNFKAKASKIGVSLTNSLSYKDYYFLGIYYVFIGDTWNAFENLLKAVENLKSIRYNPSSEAVVLESEFRIRRWFAFSIFKLIFFQKEKPCLDLLFAHQRVSSMKATSNTKSFCYGLCGLSSNKTKSILNLNSSSLDYELLISEFFEQIEFITKSTGSVDKATLIDCNFLLLLVSAYKAAYPDSHIFATRELGSPVTYLNKIRDLDTYYFYLAYCEYQYFTKKRQYDYDDTLRSIIRYRPKKIEAYLSLWQKLIYDSKRELAKEISLSIYSLIQFIEKSNVYGYYVDAYLCLIINLHLKSCELCREHSELITIAQKEYVLNLNYPTLLFQVAQ